MIRSRVIRSASLTLCAASLCGMGMSRVRMASLKATRSSPRSMASAWTPMIATPYLPSTPRLSSSAVRFRPVCPPRFGSRPSGFSFSMIWVIVWQFSGSM